MNNYFTTTPLVKWSNIKSLEYINDRLKDRSPLTHLIDGKWLSSAKLRQYRSLFGKTLGERIYIIIRDRIEREEQIRPSSPIQRSISSPIQASPINIPNTPHSSSSASSNLVMSELNLNDRKDFVDTDVRAIEHLKKEELKSQEKKDIYEYRACSDFISRHPPLLWQNNHLVFFLRDVLHIDVNASSIINIDVDEFIFMSANDINKIIPNKGDYIKKALLSKFVNPNIKRLDKPAKYSDLQIITKQTTS